jgi:tRNA U34 5-methylaminomethyl-2-thiouridine-forming methyltransferase MnmC
LTYLYGVKRKIVTTADGSKTLQIEEWQEQYHSMYGAIQEAYHVFIKHGLNLFENKAIAILEIGFGTGLNAYITFLEAQYKGLSINYYGIEAYPVSFEEAMSMEYVTSLKDADFGQEAFELMHKSPWNVPVKIASFFNLLKLEKKFQDINDSNAYELIYFDAFGFRVQPELWSESIFLKMYTALRPGGVLVTYAAKGSVRRAMVSVGFLVERLEGPPGKREMLRATKPRLNTQI